ncbi:TATA box-binding protein-associated factor RNA polymerase I subunit D [Peromyscus eremicus]|uniref:TATA box-binding protein-associated factor RNA polymerase I subunit D n=1 Tax=Peromyscus eremicus TaxID=42410 RepID=UPI0027DC5A8F|nr:TATA box-binding protein-associated factor RNA polymerase I subunit D [Peromyscus eremicus]XP_059123332.1 TATA box-binding protein-associated factor RNA polymerase I subunit D [Peromyscus eremicus]
MAQPGVSSVDCMTSDRAGDTGNQSDDSSDSLFKTQCVSSPPQRRRNPTAACVVSPVRAETDSSSDSSLEPKPLTLKAIFERFKKRKRKKRKYKPKLRPRGRPPGIKNARNPRRSQIDIKQIKDKGAVFPFLESENGRKPLPWKKILTYEQAVARGFFHHIEKLKYEQHLKECLEQMHAGEDLEKEDLDSRRHKYMDDDGPLSPIEEPLTEDEATNPESGCDIRLVEDSCFIISSEFPKRNLEQEKSKKEPAFSKKAKANETSQREHGRAWKGDVHTNIKEGLS